MAFGREGVAYLETQQGVQGSVKADGSAYAIDEVVGIYRQCLASPRAKASGVELRFQNASFAEGFQRRDWDSLSDARPVSYGFLCRHYQICLVP